MKEFDPTNVDGHYILVNGEPVEERDLIMWARWFEKNERILHVDRVSPLLGLFGGCRVSTVFLGLDHSFGSGPPLLWETMIFGGPLDGDEWRYASRSEAVAGHESAVLAAYTARNPLKRRRAYEYA